MKTKTCFSNILSAIFAVLLILSVFSVFADGIADGDWVYDRVSGDNEYYIKSYAGNAEKIRIPALFQTKPVTKINDNTFLNNTMISYVEISSTIKEIGSKVFYGCNNLSEVVFIGDTEIIGAHAFYGCTKLKIIKMERVTSLKSIPRNCFSGCMNIKDFTVPDGVESIEERAFFDCISLEAITIPSSVTEISEIAFKNCSELTINCYTDSYAQEYAENNKITYVLIDGDSQPVEPDTSNPIVPDTESTDATEGSSSEVETLPTQGDVATQPSQGETDPTEPSQEVTAPLPDATENTIPTNPTVTAPDFDPFDTQAPEPSSEGTSADAPDKTDPSSENTGKKKYIIGDTDLSGKVTVKDATLIQKYAASLVQFDKIQMFLGNCNGSGDVNVKDATQVQKYCAGFLNILFVGQEIEI